MSTIFKFVGRNLKFLLIEKVPGHELNPRQRTSYLLLGTIAILYGVWGLNLFVFGALFFSIAGTHFFAAGINGSCPIRKVTGAE